MSIQTESFSDLMYKHTLITVELSRLNSLMVYYSDCGNQPKLVAAIDAMKRLEMSKSAIAIELDKRMPNNVTTIESLEIDEDKLRPSA